ncbi:hypothetical protein FACS189431_0780 [Alphaproteobacteria bacterium]|nr:hypothetical protein FACS189431_0780 [Alphaproteobacteria bacterium]
MQFSKSDTFRPNEVQTVCVRGPEMPPTWVPIGKGKGVPRAGNWKDYLYRDHTPIEDGYHE